MIEKTHKTLFRVRCDGCEDVFNHDATGLAAVATTVEAVQDEARSRGWTFTGSFCLCRTCGAKMTVP